MSREFSTTPTEDLLLELLAARHRCGEQVWTLDSRHRRTAERLEARDLVVLMHGLTEHTFRAALSGEGRAVYMIADYVPPVLREKAGVS